MEFGCASLCDVVEKKKFAKGSGDKLLGPSLQFFLNLPFGAKWPLFTMLERYPHHFHAVCTQNGGNRCLYSSLKNIICE